LVVVETEDKQTLILDGDVHVNDVVCEIEPGVWAVDKFVKVNKVPKVDYIKMDVEGHELKVLKGAAETIQTYKPRLALSVYHRGDDLVELPKFLLALNPNYRFYLRHCAPIWADTVLYAISVDY